MEKIVSNSTGPRAALASLHRLLRPRQRLQHIIQRAQQRSQPGEVASPQPEWQEQVKYQAELDFWINIWDKRLRSGHFWNGDIRTLLEKVGEWPGGDDFTPDYDTIRHMEARAHGLRILQEVQIDDPQFFHDKIVVDIGPGAVCLLERSDARIGIAVDPLAEQYAIHNLLLPGRNTVYLAVPGEHITLASNSVDVVVSRNNLDHVRTPAGVVDEVYRILKPGGCFLLIVHLEEQATVTEPHALSHATVQSLVDRFETVNERVYDQFGRTDVGQMLAAVYRKPA
jgi:ubiquinone/menaquinone biosynthesis C-methylase UbiE